MKKLIVFAAFAAALAFATVKATASPFTITGSAVFSLTNYMKGSNNIATTTTMSLNNKFVYMLISNAVANASNGSNGLAATLPADGTIAYFPEGNDGKYNGYFYVTDKKSFYYQLSGFDANEKHYSFVELTAYDKWLGQLGPTNSASASNDCCCCDCCGLPLNFAFSANINEKTGDGSYKGIDTASLFIHMDPYPGQHVEQNELHFVGTFNPSFTLKDSFLWSPSTAKFTGIGDIVVQEKDGIDYMHGVIDKLSLSFSF